jgi:hypothetical protein
MARPLGRNDAGYTHGVTALMPKAGPRSPIRGVTAMRAHSFEPVIASSHRLYPEATTEASLVAVACMEPRALASLQARLQFHMLEGCQGFGGTHCTPPEDARGTQW